MLSLPKIWKRWRPSLFAFVVKMIMKGILFTCRIQMNGLEKFVEAASKKQACILMLWHNRLILFTQVIVKRYAPHFNYVGFVSKSRDGDLSAAFNTHKSARLIRVPHDNRHIALSILVKTLKKKDEIVVVTPDGPRGPKYKIKQGIVFAAKKTSAPIIPLTWVSSRYWKLNSWDELMIPKPFSKISIAFGDAFVLDANESLSNDQERLEATLSQLEQELRN
jgi:lysophospholipid acyltransferase (LPLAT)-like uncharacterized protein